MSFRGQLYKCYVSDGLNAVRGLSLRAAVARLKAFRGHVFRALGLAIIANVASV